MTPKEKAKELIEQFKDKVNPYIGSGMLSNTFDDDAILWQSKKCALIVCDEIDLYRGQIENEYDEDFYHAYRQEEYWEEVKKEIKNL